MECLENRVIKSLTTKVSNVSVNRDIQLFTNQALKLRKTEKNEKTRTKRDHKKADPWLIKPFRRNLVMLCLGNQLIALP